MFVPPKVVKHFSNHGLIQMSESMPVLLTSAGDITNYELSGY